MQNPGIYEPYVQTDGWPFVCFFISIVLAVVLGGVVLVFIAHHSRRQVLLGLVVAILTAASLVGTGYVMVSASARYTMIDNRKNVEYVQQVRQWLTSNGIGATTLQTRALLAGAFQPVVVGSRVEYAHLIQKFANDSISIEYSLIPSR